VELALSFCQARGRLASRRIPSPSGCLPCADLFLGGEDGVPARADSRRFVCREGRRGFGHDRRRPASMSLIVATIGSIVAWLAPAMT
jgi:hypothetical protein